MVDRHTVYSIGKNGGSSMGHIFMYERHEQFDLA